MFDFTAVSAAVIALVQDSLTLITPTTFFGGVVAASIIGSLFFRFLHGMRSLT